ncbi:replication protein [Atlantibacter subterranea]|uniref:Replication protein n=1 Tax=Atlantibacter subterraneus TaxID=255519 RepID=A0A3R9G8A9_9ENTR|nr:replication protein [Atlantibacter subterranea]RSB59076.1 replication protein [Atlantibacter subterranea]RSE03691.1 replication protein [Atlantibacter subterranea]RSE24921.1 replication protein [Atlantibacter subterranea]
MTNTAEILNFPTVIAGIQEQRVADTDDGYTRLANELYEELIGANLTKNQAKVAHAICRKTYGFNKKMDRIADTQIALLTRLPRQKVNSVKKELLGMRVLISDGLLIGPNKNLSDWKIPPAKGGPKCHHNSDSHHGRDSVTTAVTKSVTTIVTSESPQWGHTKDTITKDNKDINKPPKSPRKLKSVFDPISATLPDWLTTEIWTSWVTYRRDNGKPIKTQQTVTQAINLLERCQAKGYSPEEIINRSIANGWQGLFEPENPAKRQRAVAVDNSPHWNSPEAWRDFL